MDLSVLKAIFASMEQGIVFVDDQNRIAYCNPAAEEIRNIKLDEVVGKSILECHPFRAHEKVIQIIDELKSGRMEGHQRMNIQMVEGKFYDNTYSAVWGPHNKYLGVIVVTQEVTRRKHAEDNLKEALQKLEVANE
jgi:PAS domain S-box-containing protein